MQFSNRKPTKSTTGDVKWQREFEGGRKEPLNLTLFHFIIDFTLQTFLLLVPFNKSRNEGLLFGMFLKNDNNGHIPYTLLKRNGKAKNKVGLFASDAATDVLLSSSISLDGLSQPLQRRKNSMEKWPRMLDFWFGLVHWLDWCEMTRIRDRPNF